MTLPTKWIVTMIIPSLVNLILFGPIIVRASTDILGQLNKLHSTSNEPSASIQYDSSYWLANPDDSWQVSSLSRSRKYLSRLISRIDEPTYNGAKEKLEQRLKRSQTTDTTSTIIHSAMTLEGPQQFVNLSRSQLSVISSMPNVESSQGQDMNSSESISMSLTSPSPSLQDDSIEQPPLYMQRMTVILVILHVAVFITGLIGNLLVCLSVYRNKSLQTVTNYYIVNLAVADFLVILICLPPTVYWDLTLTWNFGLILCKLVLYLQILGPFDFLATWYEVVLLILISMGAIFSLNVRVCGFKFWLVSWLSELSEGGSWLMEKSTSVSVSVLTLTCISVDRWYAICRPLQFSSTKYRVKISIALVWILSMLIAAPDVVFLTTKPVHEENDFVYMDCIHSWPEQNTRIYQLCIVTLLFICPFVLMTISYAHIVNVLWRNETMAESLQHSIQLEEEHQNQQRYQQQHQDEPQRHIDRLAPVNETIISSKHEYPIKIIDDHSDKVISRSKDKCQDNIINEKPETMVKLSFHQGQYQQTFSCQNDKKDGSASEVERKLSSDLSSPWQSGPHVSSGRDKLISSTIEPSERNIRGLDPSREDSTIETYESGKIARQGDALSSMPTGANSCRGRKSSSANRASWTIDHNSGSDHDGLAQISPDMSKELEDDRKLTDAKNLSGSQVLVKGSNSHRIEMGDQIHQRNSGACTLSQQRSMTLLSLVATPSRDHDGLDIKRMHNSTEEPDKLRSVESGAMKLNSGNQCSLSPYITTNIVSVETNNGDLCNGALAMSNIDKIVKKEVDKKYHSISASPVSEDNSTNHRDILYLKTQRKALIKKLDSAEAKSTFHKSPKSKSGVGSEELNFHKSDSITINDAQDQEAGLSKHLAKDAQFCQELGSMQKDSLFNSSDSKNSRQVGHESGPIGSDAPQMRNDLGQQAIVVCPKRSRTSDDGNFIGCCKWFLKSKDHSNPSKGSGLVSGKTSKRYQRNLDNYAARQDDYRQRANAAAKTSASRQVFIGNTLDSCSSQISETSTSRDISNSMRKKYANLKPSKMIPKSHLISMSSESFRSIDALQMDSSKSTKDPRSKVRADKKSDQLPVDTDTDIVMSTSSNYNRLNSTTQTRFYKLIESRKKAAKMLIVIVIMFGLCYLPIHFLNILRYTVGLPQNDITTIASLVSHWLCYFNSAINPLIYNLMSDASGGDIEAILIEPIKIKLP